jgi:hypothetical protein
VYIGVKAILNTSTELDEFIDTAAPGIEDLMESLRVTALQGEELSSDMEPIANPSTVEGASPLSPDPTGSHAVMEKGEGLDAEISASELSKYGQSLHMLSSSKLF